MLKQRWAAWRAALPVKRDSAQYLQDSFPTILSQLSSTKEKKEKKV